MKFVIVLFFILENCVFHEGWIPDEVFFKTGFIVVSSSSTTRVHIDYRGRRFWESTEACVIWSCRSHTAHISRVKKFFTTTTTIWSLNLSDSNGLKNEIEKNPTLKKKHCLGSIYFSWSDTKLNLSTCFYLLEKSKWHYAQWAKIQKSLT